MKTRHSKPKSKPNPPTEQTPPSITQILPSSLPQPPHLFVLPRHPSSSSLSAPTSSPHARIVTLPHPATGNPTRFFADPLLGFYDFTRISAPKKPGRSWLLAPDRLPAKAVDDSDNEKGAASRPTSTELGDQNEHDDGYVLQQPDLFLATAIDPLFLLLPALWPADDGAGRPAWGTFHDRLFFAPAARATKSSNAPYAQLQKLLKSSGGRALEEMLEARMKAVCQCLDTGDEDVSYTLHPPALVSILLHKAHNMVAAGLPASMEEQFVRKALELPERSVRREESGISMAGEDAGVGAYSQGTTSVETSQTSEASTAATTSTSTSASTAATSPAMSSTDLPATSNITHLLRLRAALTFLLKSYIPPDLASHLETVLRLPDLGSRVDFAPLDKHLAHIASLRAQAQALRSISDNISRKRGGFDDDDDALEKADAKKQKREEEEAKKKNVSMGVKRLAKVNTTGMKKMSSFFQKAPAKKG